MKCFKRLLSILLIASLLCTFAFADSGKLSDSRLYDDVRAPEVCAGLPYHEMMSNGWCSVYKGFYPDFSNLLFNGFQWQCLNCYLTMGTTGDLITLGASIGTYAIAEAFEPNQAVADIWVDRTYYTSSSKLNGYKFMDSGRKVIE